MKKNRGVNAANLNIWEGCHGEYFAPGDVCRHCGKPREAHDISAEISSAEPQRNVERPLDKAFAIQKSLFRADRPIRVVITRGYRGKKLDSDNLAGSLKAIRDEITRKILRMPDDADSETLTWEYRQSPGSGVLVEIYQE